jgi:hypothetical protein
MNRPSLAVCMFLSGCSGLLGRDASPPSPIAPASNLPSPDNGMPGTMPLPTEPPVAGGTVRGILDCPTTDLPAYGVATDTTLSAPFQQNCATCHGGAGQGGKGYPALPGKLTASEYKAVIRTGRKDMPAFDSAFVTDSQIAADFAALQRLGSAPPGPVARKAGPETWTVAEIESAYAKGLNTWRKAGSVDGQACTHCHSPDGVELAIIGYSDDAILRRAQQHLNADDALFVRDFIHVQRRKFGIAKTCSPDWRPFQPGGDVLAADSASGQDAIFLKSLNERKLMLAAGTVVTLDDAKKAFQELQAVDVRRLPMGIPLPRFSEDKFNGPAHRDVNDYMPIVPTAPNDAASFFQFEDEYLKNPTDAKLFELLELNRTKTNDLGYQAKFGKPNNPRSNCGAFADKPTTAWLMERINQPKRLNVLVAAHFFREEIRKPGSFYARPNSPFVEASSPVNPSFFLGAFAIEPPCYDSLNYPNWVASFPSGLRDELPENSSPNEEVSDTTDRITHPWMTLGQIFDPALVA